jgi:adenylate kinase family enzyme
MHIFILGSTKVGKTTLANKLLPALARVKPFELYEAGAWARNEYSPKQSDLALVQAESSLYRQGLSQFALTRLNRDPLYSLRKFVHWQEAAKPENVLIVGVRNPDDFLGMLALEKHNVVIRMPSLLAKADDPFDEGLKVIDAYLAWKRKVGSSIKQVAFLESPLLDSKQIDALVKEALGE